MMKMTMYDLKELTNPVYMKWGTRMPLMAAEEAGELIQAVSKLERKLYVLDRDILTEVDNVTEEMGDVLIAIGALANRYGIPAVDIEMAIEEKLSQERTC